MRSARPRDVPDANLRQADCVFRLVLHLTLEECESLARGDLPDAVRLALQTECAARLPVLRGEAFDFPRGRPC